MRKIIRLVAVLVIAGVLAAACGHLGHSKDGSKASSVAASAAANPALQRDAHTALTQLAGCAKSQAGMTVTVPAIGSTTMPTVSGVSVHDAKHPWKTLEAIVRCTPAGKQGGRKAVHCAERTVLGNGAGQGVVARDLYAVAGKCLDGKK